MTQSGTSTAATDEDAHERTQAHTQTNQLRGDRRPQPQQQGHPGQQLPMKNPTPTMGYIQFKSLYGSSFLDLFSQVVAKSG